MQIDLKDIGILFPIETPGRGNGMAKQNFNQAYNLAQFNHLIIAKTLDHYPFWSM